MSLTTEDIEDIKQRMYANIRVLMTQLEEVIDTKLEQKLEEKLEEKLAPIRQDIRDLTEFVQDAITTSNDASQEQIDDHEVRITRLEQKTA